MKRLGLVLGSGGSRGVAHIGVLKVLEEHGIKPSVIYGSSMGAVVGSCYAKGYSPQEMYDIVKSFKMRHLVDVSIAAIKNQAVLTSKKMNNMLKKYLGEHTTFDDLPILFKCVALDIVSGKPHIFGGDENLVKGVSASSTIPGVFKPIKNGSALYVDGGVVERLPIKYMKEEKVDVIIAVDVLGKNRVVDKPYNLFTLLTRAFEITDFEITELKLKKYKPNLLLMPELGGISQYKIKDIDLIYEAGVHECKKHIRRIKNLLKD